MPDNLKLDKDGNIDISQKPRAAARPSGAPVHRPAEAKGPAQKITKKAAPQKKQPTPVAINRSMSRTSSPSRKKKSKRADGKFITIVCVIALLLVVVAMVVMATNIRRSPEPADSAFSPVTTTKVSSSPDTTSEATTVPATSDTETTVETTTTDTETTVAESTTAESTTVETTKPVTTTAATTTASASSTPAGVVSTTTKGYAVTKENGAYYVNVNGTKILVANKTYALDKSYNPGGLTSETNTAFNKLVSDASKSGLTIYLKSGFRSYSTQVDTYNYWVSVYGKAQADRISARPGYSEHQSGLAIDVVKVKGAKLDENFINTAEGKWIAAHAHEYGFIVRYTKQGESKTGYQYEPWHIRYVGSIATDIYNSGLTLEEYLGISSAYSD